jgi:hypothetical protein
MDPKQRKAEYDRQYYARNRERLRAANKAYYEKHAEELREYQHKYREQNYEKCLAANRAAGKKWRDANPEESRAQSKKYGWKLKLEVIAAYGGKCTCCGEATPEFLGIDHIYGGGRKHRAVLRGHRFYYWLKQQGFPKDEYQLHCHNCNMAKGFFGVCPHRQR